MSAEMAAAIGTWAPILAMIAIFYFMLYRPQKNAQKKRMEMLDSLKRGNRVVTVGGIYGTIESLTDKKVSLRIADNVVIEMARASINGTVEDED